MKKLVNENYVGSHLQPTHGEKAVKTHINSIKHKRMIQNINSNQLLTTFIPQENSAENFKVAIAEMSQIYHSVSHHHSYLSMDCGIKLNSKIYDDSKLSKKNTLWENKIREYSEKCTRTKIYRDGITGNVQR